jgi:hypothetical protein
VIRVGLVGITTRILAGFSRLKFRSAKEIFSSPKRPNRFWGSPSFLLMRTELPGVNRPEREVNHCPSPHAEFKIEWSYTSVLHTRLQSFEGDKYVFAFAVFYRYKEETHFFGADVLLFRSNWLKWVDESPNFLSWWNQKQFPKQWVPISVFLKHRPMAKV